MTDTHPPHYIVQALRNNIVVHAQEAKDYEDAVRLKNKFESVANTIGEIVKVHDPAVIDLTTHTREIVEEIASRANA